MEPDSLQKHLQEYQDQGQLFDRGEITLNPEKAREKLANFSLPEAGFWVLKLVQAAVACESTGITFTFERKRVRVRFLNTANWRAGQILDQINSGLFSQDRALRHLQTAIIAGYGPTNETVIWECGGERAGLDKNGVRREKITEDQEFSLLATRSSRRTSLSQKFSSPLRYLFRQTAHEFKALVAKSMACPIPISVDGLEFPRRYGRNAIELTKAPNFDGESTQGLRLLLAVRPINEFPEQKTLHYPISEPSPGEGQAYTQSRENFSTQYWVKPQGECQAVLCLVSVQQYVHELSLVHDGILLERLPLKEAIPEKHKAQAFLDLLYDKKEDFILSLTLEVNPGQIDLSHFGVDKRGLGDLVLRLQPALIETLEALKANCRRPWKFETLPGLSTKFKNLSAGELLLGPFIPGLIGAVLGLGAVFLVFTPIFYLFSGRVEQKKMRQLEERFEETLDRLREHQGD